MPKANSHEKPSKEELEAGVQGTLDALDGMEPPKPDDEPEVPPEDKGFVDPEKEEGKADDEGNAIEDPKAPKKKKEEKPETPPAEPKKEEGKEGEEPTTPDPVTRHRHSTAEAQVLASQNRRLETAILEADELPEPTDDEMKEAEPEWEDMSPTEQRLARRVLHSERKNAIIAKAGKEGHAVNQWMDQVDVYLSDPTNLTAHPELEGKEEEFKTFAIKPTRRGADFEDLVPAFLYSIKAEPAAPPKKPKMFESGGNSGEGERPKQNDGKISLMEARRLRVTNYPKYLEYLRGGKIDNSDL